MRIRLKYKLKYILYPLIIFIIIIFIAPYFIQNISFLISEKSTKSIIKHQWSFVLFYIILFSIFIIFLMVHPIKEYSWKKTHGIYMAFIVALFTEMFGIPLSIYLLSSFLYIPSTYNEPSIAFTFSLTGRSYNLLMTSLIAAILTIFSLIIIVSGWKKIYYSNGELVTDGVYKYVRHPQYLGILIITTVWLFAWPTLFLIIMYPFLIYAYYRLSKNEEMEMINTFGSKYKEYMERTPMFLPFTKE